MPYCIKLDGGFTDATALDSSIDLEQTINRISQDFCSDTPLWDSLKLAAQFQEIRNLQNPVVYLACELKIPQDSQATSEDYDRLTFEIVPSINAITNLSSNSEFGDQLTEGGNPFDLYKVHLPSNFTATVEVEPCLGEVELQIFKSVQALRKNSYQDVIRQLDQGKIQFFYEDLAHSDKSSQIFFKVQLVIEKRQDDPTPAVATYRIRAHLKNALLAHQKLEYIPSHEGMITVTQSSSQKVQIAWGELMERSSQGIQQLVSASNVEYSIYESPYNTFNLEALCTLIQYTTLLQSQFGITKYEVQNSRKFQENETQIHVYMNVVATVISTRQAIPYKRVEIVFFKEEQEIEEGIAMTYRNIILIVGVVVVLVAVMFGVMHYKSKEMERHQMEYEVEDVRETAHIELATMGSGASSRKSLHEESDE